MRRAGTVKMAKQKWAKTHPAFTLAEVLVALAIVSISLLTLLKLHIISIRLADTAEITSQAALVADEKMTEILATGYPQVGSNSGTVERNNLRFEWRSEVTDLQLPQPGEVAVGGLRKVSIDVGWKNGPGKKHLETSTYIADRKLK
jgi:type II secretion system protein I